MGCLALVVVLGFVLCFFDCLVHVVCLEGCSAFGAVGVVVAYAAVCFPVALGASAVLIGVHRFSYIVGCLFVL